MSRTRNREGRSPNQFPPNHGEVKLDESQGTKDPRQKGRSGQETQGQGQRFKS